MTTPHAEPPTDVASSGHADAGHAADQDDDHGHATVGLGPVDWSAWTAGAVGVAIGLITALCFVLATAGIAPNG